MPFDSQGNFTRLHNWEDDRQNDVEIVTDNHDEEDDNFAAGLNLCFLRDGRAAMQNNLDAGNFQVKNVRAATFDKDAVNLKQLTEKLEEAAQKLVGKINQGMKVGDIKASVLTANHDNWLLCNGQEISRADYPDLFKIIGINFGSGNGTTTFNVPDYRGKFLRGLGGDSAADMYQTQAEGLPNVTGTLGNEGRGRWNNLSGALYQIESGTTYIGANGPGAYPTKIGLDLSKSNKLYGASAHVTPVNQAVNYFIKAKTEV